MLPIQVFLSLIVAAAKLFGDAGAFDLADVVEWDVWNWSLALNFWESFNSLDLQNCLVLELGAANGGLSLWLALKGARVVSSDLHGPTPAARQLHGKYGVGHLIEYRCVDATSIPYENRFDLVVFKSMLGDIGRGDRPELQARAVGEMFKALKPGGELWFAENLSGSALHRVARRFIKRGRLWRYLTVPEIEQLMSPFIQQSHVTAGFLGVFGRGGALRNALGAVDRLLCNRLLPDRWKYAIFVRARKGIEGIEQPGECPAGGQKRCVA